MGPSFSASFDRSEVTSLVKNEGAVRHKLQQACFRHLKRAIRKRLSRRPENCGNNLVVGPLAHGGSLRVCGLAPDRGSLPPCDEAHGGLEKVAGCPFFKPSSTEESVRGEVAAFLRGAPLEEVAVHYPDVAALRWVLGEAGSEPDGGQASTSEEPEPPTPPGPRRLPVFLGEPEPPAPVLNGYRFTVVGGPYRWVRDELEPARGSWVAR